jgi:hypothetical protein
MTQGNPRIQRRRDERVRIGTSFGTAVLAVILQRQLADHAASTAGRAAAFGTTFGWTLALRGVALIPALFVPPKPRPVARGISSPGGVPRLVACWCC